MNAKRSQRLTDLHMVVLSWLTFYPDHRPADIANELRADVDEIERLCANLLASGLIEPTTWHYASALLTPKRRQP